MSDIPSLFRERIEAALKRQLKHLDLSNSSKPKLTTIPSKVFQLEHLESLDLSGNDISQVPARIENLRNLKTLNLSRNRLDAIPTSIGRLSDLEALNLGNNQLQSLPAEVGHLANLRTLEVQFNQLTSLPEEIDHLYNLMALDLAANDIVKFPDLSGLKNLTTLRLWTDRENPAQVPGWLSRLKNIESFALIRFGLSRVPDWLAQWKSLRIMNLSGNSLTSLPDWIGAMQNLVNLWLVSNQLVGVPESFSRLQGLRLLGLWENNISAFPLPILGLQDLRYLDLGRNQLTSIPAAISRLQQLETLELRQNKLTTMPVTLMALANLKRLSLEENPLEVPPPEIASQGAEAVREYFRQLTVEGTDHLYEAKLLIVGEGGAGKTTLANKIQHPEYRLREEDSTRGIDVLRWQFPLDNGRTFQVNIWDFGGQEIYHATHQFFLTKRSLYVLVADTRKEDTDFYYWLNVTELLSDNSPILIIKNEKQDRHREIDERALRGQFTHLKETLATNLATCRGLEKVVEEICHRISHLPHVGTPLPKTWVRVREELEKDPRNYIGLEEYLSICEKHGFSGTEAKLQLSGYLHDLGVCLHFQDDPLLSKMVILKPKWGTDAVYKVLDNPQVIRNLGRFTRADLRHIWDEPEYAAVQDELLQLMMKFKLCYPLPDVKATYIAPQLLSAQQPDFLWEEADNLLLRYTYEFMPKGILTQFIVAMHGFIAEQRLVWKSGVVLARDQTLAEVREHYDRREIRIRVAGKHRKELLVIADHELEKIHDSYQRLKYNKLVPCNCATCKNSPEPHFYPLAVLRRFIEDRQSRIQCQKSYEMVDVLGLVDDVVGREQLLPVEARIRSGAAEEPRSQVLIHGTVEQVVVQQTSGKNGGIMGDQYNVHGQAGAVGPNAHAHDMTFNQVWNQLEPRMDLAKLADDLGRLREAMDREAIEPGHRLAAGAVAAAEQSAREKDGPKVIEYLKTAGKWAWGIAEKIGADLAKEALKGALGL